MKHQTENAAGETLQRMYLELAHVIPPGCRSFRDIENENRIDLLERTLKQLLDEILPDPQARRLFDGLVIYDACRLVGYSQPCTCSEGECDAPEDCRKEASDG